jgi:hypothetical protein
MMATPAALNQAGSTRADGSRRSATACLPSFTLLVLDLSSRSSPGQVLADLLRQWPAYVAYLASFGLVGVIWVNHPSS